MHTALLFDEFKSKYKLATNKVKCSCKTLREGTTQNAASRPRDIRSTIFYTVCPFSTQTLIEFDKL